MTGCFTCLNCGRNNTIKGHSYTNKYCNNSCQQQHRSRSLVKEWLESPTQNWRQAPEWVKRHLIDNRGHRCEVCEQTMHNSKPIPLQVDHLDRNSHNYDMDNLQLICPNCRSQR
jgi:hypothetical protein